MKISTDFDENWAFGTDVGMFYGGFDIEIGWKPQKQSFWSKNSKFLIEMLSNKYFCHETIKYRSDFDVIGLKRREFWWETRFW